MTNRIFYTVHRIQVFVKTQYGTDTAFIMANSTDEFNRKLKLFIADLNKKYPSDVRYLSTDFNPRAINEMGTMDFINLVDYLK